MVARLVRERDGKSCRRQPAVANQTAVEADDSAITVKYRLRVGDPGIEVDFIDQFRKALLKKSNHRSRPSFRPTGLDRPEKARSDEGVEQGHWRDRRSGQRESQS